MKIIICTTPIRPEPTSYPPFGSMALIQSLRAANYDPIFYDIDGLRPSFEEVVDFFREQQPDMLGISAVVSTAYAYTKQLVLEIKKVSPKTKILVGGNLAASSEILLRFCKVDACGIGEGENVIVNIAKYWEAHSDSDDYTKLRRITGLAFLNSDAEVIFTGYDSAIPASDFLSPDWSILEQFSKIENFIQNPMIRHDFAQDPRSHQAHRSGKMLATAITAKGCVARCTFCHRWDKGYRHWPVDRIMENIHYLIEKYNVGFFAFTDENFGSDRKKTDELIERLKPLDILYQVGGVRCRSVDPGLLSRLKDSGCVAMYYGMESGSPSILEVMEKNTSLQQNIDAARWTHEAGIYTIYQMVLAMPGENQKTIGETSKFIQQVTEFLPESPRNRLSINYVQALPGTAVYEYARETGLIGSSLEEEEQYLIDISDIDAADDAKFLNFTNCDYLTVQMWRSRIVFDAEANWYKKRGWKPEIKPNVIPLDTDSANEDIDNDYNRGGYFNLGHSVIRHPLFFKILSSPLGYPLREIYLLAYVFVRNLRLLTTKRFVTYTGAYLYRKIIRRRGLQDIRSLRKVMTDRTPVPITTSEQSTQPIRDGR